MRTRLAVLGEVDPGAEFHSMVKRIAKAVRPQGQWAVALLDDLPDTSARLDLVRLAVLVALDQAAEHFQILPVTGCRRHESDHVWLISRAEPARGFTFINGTEPPPERTVTLSEDDTGIVHVAVGHERIEVRPPSEQECLRLLNSGARGTVLRFPVFPSSGSSLVARGDAPDELVLWRCGLPAAKFRLPGPVLAATYVSDTIFESLIALIEVDGELVVHVEGDQDLSARKLRVPIGFSVADETEHDLSPLYLDMDEMWRFGVYFRRAGQWWNLHYYGGHITLEPSRAHLHGPESHSFHARLSGAEGAIYGPGHSYTGHHTPAPDGWEEWKVWGTSHDDPLFIRVPPGEDVVSLTKIGDEPALLTRAGDLVQARTRHDVRTVIEFGGPLVLHPHLPWVAVQRSAHLVEVLDVATGAVLHRLDTA